ncbi:MAG: pilus assembly protein [Actinomycetaceae bacterium]|nr:pilus assembly protein [Actinomycetaceae bacterium]
MTTLGFVARQHIFLPEDREEKGNAIAGFVLIIPLVFLVLFALISLIYGLHIRFLAEDAAFEGAKAGSLSGGDSVLAERRTRDVLAMAFKGEYCANPDITSQLLPDEGIEVSLHCPAHNSSWFGTSLPEVTVSAYAHIE